MVEGMVKEICTNYGELFEIWFDGGADHPDNGAPDVLPIVRKYQPNCLFYHNGQLAEARWGGSESGTVGYPCWSTFPYPATGAGESAKKNIAKDGFKLLKHGDPDGEYWVPAMSDAPLRGYNGRHEWFWEPGDEEHIFPTEKLVDMYYKSVGRNSTLILGLTPDPTGLMPEPDVKRLKEFGDEIKKRFSDPVATTEGNQLTIKLKSKEVINQVVVSEEIAQGERVREFVVEGKTVNGWQTLTRGQSIGHKYIATFDDIEVSAVRLVVHKSRLKPVIKKMTVYKI
jgi:alpha-L-fucosidase